MRKLENIDRFLIAALLLFSIMFCSSAFSQGLGVMDDNPNIYGEWKSMDGEHTLYMNYLEEFDLDNFVRISPAPPYPSKVFTYASIAKLSSNADD